MVYVENDDFIFVNYVKDLHFCATFFILAKKRKSNEEDYIIPKFDAYQCF
ncbi:MAG: hypothetical protein Wins2KO_16880 [Winogradskyella sp.]